LVAYLDGELEVEQRAFIADQVRTDPVLAARLEALQCADLPFKAAFDSVLGQAPTARMQAMLNALPAAQAPALSRRRFLAVAAGFAVAGAVADRLFISWPRAQSAQGWRASVAEYMAL
jgi:anti-sigma factor RsiW